MSKIKIILTQYNDKLLFALFENDNLIELSINGNEDSIGSVFLCRVVKKIDNIGGCIIQYKPKYNGFLKNSKLKCEEIVPLQLKKEGTNNKEPLFTEKISISSTYAVITRGNPEVLYSAKLDDLYKAKYKDIYKELSHKLNLKIIIRTNASNTNCDNVVKDIENLNNKLIKIEKHSSDRVLYSILYKPLPFYIDVIDKYKLTNDIDIITDLNDIYSVLVENYSFEQQKNINIKLYDDEMISLFHLYKMDHNIKNATSRIVSLKSGGSIVIDQTEAFVAIDVNTHFSSSNKNAEVTFYETNMEAAKEIVRQIRIRNLSGMIIIDFLKMKEKWQYDKLVELLNNLSKNDPNNLKVIDVTGLKLVEMVRTKKRQTLINQITR